MPAAKDLDTLAIFDLARRSAPLPCPVAYRDAKGTCRMLSASQTRHGAVVSSRIEPVITARTGRIRSRNKTSPGGVRWLGNLTRQSFRSSSVCCIASTRRCRLRRLGERCRG